MLICMLGERPQAILNRLALRRQSHPGDIQFPYYLPDEGAVVATSRVLHEVASAHGDNAELLWIDTRNDIRKALRKIRRDTVFWPVTDGYSPFLGSSLIGLLRGFGGQVFGSGPAATAFSQNKYMQYALFRSLGISTPETWHSWAEIASPDCGDSYIAKPVDLGNSIGIFDDGVACGWQDAIVVADRILASYGRQAIIQNYIDGIYCRASFVGANPIAGNIGVYVFSEIDSENGSYKWAGFDAYLNEYKRRDSLSNSNVKLLALDEAVNDGVVSKRARARLAECLTRLVQGTDLSGIFTIDIVVRGDTPYFIEVNTNPFLRNVALQAYCREEWGHDVVTALYKAILAFCSLDV